MNADAVRTVLEGEHAAVYAYGIVAARLTGSDQKRALSAMAAHRAGRDLLLARLAEAQEAAVAAAPAYTLPAPVTDARSAKALAALVEDRLAGQWAGLAAQSDGDGRSSAALAAEACAVRSVTWSGVAPVWSGAV